MAKKICNEKDEMPGLPYVGKYIDLMFDRGFKRVFGKEANKDLLIALLREILPEVNIVNLKLLNGERHGLSPQSKNSVFDVCCETGAGEKVIIEVQFKPQAFFRERVLYYASLPVLEELDKGDDYRLVPVYVISIMNFTTRHGEYEKPDSVEYRFSIREEETGEMMTDALHFIFLELGKFNKKEEELVTDKEKWYFCIKHMKDLGARPESLQEAVFKRLFEVTHIESLPKQDKIEYYKDMTTEKDIRGMISYAKEEGHAAGVAAAKLEMAKAMLTDGVSAETVAKYSGLSLRQIQAL